MEDYDLLELIRELKLLRSELKGQAEIRTLERIDEVISELESSGVGSLSPERILKLLGMILEYLPTVITIVDILMSKK
jgi:hypothetical protein